MVGSQMSCLPVWLSIGQLGPMDKRFYNLPEQHHLLETRCLRVNLWWVGGVWWNCTTTLIYRCIDKRQSDFTRGTKEHTEIVYPKSSLKNTHREGTLCSLPLLMKARSMPCKTLGKLSGLDPQNPSEKEGVLIHTFNPNTWEADRELVVNSSWAWLI